MYGSDENILPIFNFKPSLYYVILSKSSIFPQRISFITLLIDIGKQQTD